jgi:hypothetical protein
MENRLSYLLSITWLINAYNKYSTPPAALQEQTRHFASNSIVPVIPDLFHWASSYPELWQIFSTIGFTANALLIIPEKTRKLGVIGSITANLLIYSVAHSGGIPVLVTNLLMIGIASIIGLGILEES